MFCFYCEYRPAESFQNVLLFQPFVAPVPNFLRPLAGIKFDISSFSGYKRLNIYVLCVLLWIKYWLMWLESILFKFKKHPNISGIRFVIQIQMQLVLEMPNSPTEPEAQGSLIELARQHWSSMVHGLRPALGS